MSGPYTSLIGSGDPLAGKPAPEVQDEAQKAPEAAAPQAQDHVAEPPPATPEIQPANPTTLFRAANPAEANKVWKYLKQEFGVQERFHGACLDALDKILAGRTADEFISFIEDLKEAFPKTFRKGFGGWLKETFNPQRTCDEKSGHILAAEGVTHDTSGARISEADDYTACNGYNVFGMDSYEVESTLRNLAMIQDLGPDVVPFLKRYSKIMGEEFALTDAQVFITPYEMEKESPGLWERYEKLYALFENEIRAAEKEDRNIQWVPTNLIEIAQLGQTAMERVIEFHKWVDARHGMELGALEVIPYIPWEGERYERFLTVLEWMDENKFFIRFDKIGLAAVTAPGVLDDKEILNFAEKVLSIFKPERIPHLFAEIPRLKEIETAGVPMEEIRDFQIDLEKRAPSPLKIGHGHSDDYYSTLARHIVGIIPKSIYYNEKTSVIINGESGDYLKEIWQFTRAMFNEDPQIAALMDWRNVWDDAEYTAFIALLEKEHGRDGMEKAARAIPQMLRLQISYAPADRRERVLFSHYSYQIYIEQAADALFDRDHIFGSKDSFLNFDAEKARNDINKLHYFVSKFRHSPGLYMAFSPGMLDFMLLTPDQREKILSWDAMSVAEEIAAEDLGREKVGEPGVESHLFLFRHGNRGVIIYPLFLSDEEDVTQNPSYQAILTKREIYDALDDGVRRELDSALASTGRGIEMTKLDFVRAMLEVIGDPELYEEFKVLQADAKEKMGFGIRPPASQLENLIEGYAAMKAKGIADGFWKVVGYAPELTFEEGMLELMPLWTDANDDERHGFIEMTVEQGITPIGWPNNSKDWIKAMRSLLPYSKERKVIAGMKDEGSIAIWTLVDADFKANREFLGDAAFIARHGGEYRSAKSKLIKYYKADTDLSSYYDWEVLSKLSPGYDRMRSLSLYRGMMEAEDFGFSWPADDIYQTVVYGDRTERVHPWIADSDMDYSYDPSDHWFLENAQQILRSMPRLRTILEGKKGPFAAEGRDAILVDVRKRLKRVIPMQRRIGKSDDVRMQDTWLDWLSTADLAKMWVVLHALGSSGKRDEIGRMLDKDLRDGTTEYGGVFDGAFKFIAPRETGDDGAYVPDDQHKYSRGIADFHFHSVKEGLEGILISDRYGNLKEAQNGYFAGPSRSDMLSTLLTLKDSIVITRLSDSSFNVDFYARPKEIVSSEEGEGLTLLEYFERIQTKMVVIDLGVYYHDANEIPPDVAEKDPGEKEAEQVVAGAQNVHLF